MLCISLFFLSWNYGILHAIIMFTLSYWHDSPTLKVNSMRPIFLADKVACSPRMFTSLSIVLNSSLPCCVSTIDSSDRFRIYNFWIIVKVASMTYFFQVVIILFYYIPLIGFLWSRLFVYLCCFDFPKIYYIATGIANIFLNY